MLRHKSVQILWSLVFMKHTDQIPRRYQDPLRQAILGDCQSFDEPSQTFSYLLLFAMAATTFLLAWFHQDVMFYLHFYFELLMSLCS